MIMCGIAGVKGKNAARLSLLVTLGQLERGVYSTGIAYLHQGKVKVIKRPISPIRFFMKYYDNLPHSATVAISHNRFPSVGDVSYVNCHPFSDCRKQFYLIHNGHGNIVQEKRKDIKKEHNIYGQTDSEIYTHMLEDFYLNDNDMVSAITSLLKSEFVGAIIILTKTGKLYGTRLGPYPLCYCITKQHVIMASSQTAIDMLTNKKYEIIALDEGDIITVDAKVKIEKTHIRSKRYWIYYDKLIDKDENTNKRWEIWKKDFVWYF